MQRCYHKRSIRLWTRILDQIWLSQLNLNTLTYSFIKKKLYKKGIIVFYILILHNARLLLLVPFTLSHNNSVLVLDLVLFVLILYLTLGWWYDFLFKINTYLKPMLSILKNKIVNCNSYNTELYISSHLQKVSGQYTPIHSNISYWCFSFLVYSGHSINICHIIHNLKR